MNNADASICPFAPPLHLDWREHLTDGQVESLAFAVPPASQASLPQDGVEDVGTRGISDLTTRRLDAPCLSRRRAECNQLIPFHRMHEVQSPNCCAEVWRLIHHLRLSLGRGISLGNRMDTSACDGGARRIKPSMRTYFVSIVMHRHRTKQLRQ